VRQRDGEQSHIDTGRSSSPSLRGMVGCGRGEGVTVGHRVGWWLIPLHLRHKP